MAELNLVIRTADRSRKAEINIDENQKCVDIMEAAKENWSLNTSEHEFVLTNISKSPPQTINPELTLAKAGIEDGETLELQQIPRGGLL